MSEFQSRSTGQAREAARRVGEQVRGEADTQTNRLAQGIRGFADDLDSMSSSGNSDSAAAGLVRQAADGGRQAADWLDHRGLDGLLDEMRSFARRRPGMFLLGAAVAGFAAGRLAKATATEITANEPVPEQRTEVPDGYR